MKIGLLDVDNYTKINNNEKVFPNLPLMKISAYHKNNGDITEFYNDNNYYDIVYASKVFSFTKDVSSINADTIVRGGLGIVLV